MAKENSKKKGTHQGSKYAHWPKSISLRLYDSQNLFWSENLTPGMILFESVSLWAFWAYLLWKVSSQKDAFWAWRGIWKVWGSWIGLWGPTPRLWPSQSVGKYSAGKQKVVHIFPRAQVTSNIWNDPSNARKDTAFLAQVFMPFPMAWVVSFQNLVCKTTK